MFTESTDVVVIGAGVTGLTAATRLRRAGLSVRVLEARDRVGGRLHTDVVDGVPLEIGGQWVSPDQDALIETLAELGLETFSRFRDGDSVYVGPDGTARRFIGDIFPAPEKTQREIERLIEVIDARAAEVDPEAPWAHPRATELDSISFWDWLGQHTSDAEARENVSLFIAEAMMTKPSHAFSALQALFFAASAGSFSHLVDADFILDKRVVGGLQQVPLRLAAELGDAVLLERPVHRVEWDERGEGVVVHTTDRTVAARFAVVAVPPVLYPRIGFSPALPRLVQQAHQHQSFGLVIKVHAVYERPFWREAGLSGTAFSPYQVVHEAYDNSNHGDGRGILVGFASDVRADALFGLGAAERKQRVLESLAAYYGAEALTPVVYYESDWAAEEWTRGAYATSFDLGGLSRYGAAQRVPVGPVHFASSDLAGKGFQHVDGGIRVGREVADAILAATTTTAATDQARAS
ncbi:NAD(P)/FAD-dependent oxidoreductase [Kineococcus glutinatus]|uniref:NAD(P)/FAD-dependent oxidoreductase n=1 Tax=Kineococcus glutinatus TaxID=1070872 RepID=A0ABP9H6U8_9ACTN